MATGQTSARRMDLEFPLGSDPVSISRRIEMLEHVLERAISLPGMRRKVGLDAVMGLVPVAGDLVSAALGMYIVWEARRLGMPKWQLARMTVNVGVDTLLGAVPVAGDLFDFVFRSNSRNLKIVRKHIAKHHPHARVIEG